MCKSIEDCYDTGNIHRYQLTKPYKMAVSFVLSNANFLPLPTVSKLHSTSINAVSDKHFSNIITVAPFLKTILPISKNFVPKNKPVCQLLRSTLCKSELVPIKRHTVNHALCKSFLSRYPIPVVESVVVVNVNVKFTLLRSRVHVVKSLFHPLRVSILKALKIFTVNTTPPPNVCKAISRINHTHHKLVYKSYTSLNHLNAKHTTAVNNPKNISY